MPWIILHRIRLPPPRRINQLYHDQTFIIHAICFCNGERIPLHRLDWSPYVDDLHPAFYKLLRIFGEVVRDAGQGRAIRLIDVHALNRAAETVECNW